MTTTSGASLKLDALLLTLAQAVPLSAVPDACFVEPLNLTAGIPGTAVPLASAFSELHFLTGRA